MPRDSVRSTEPLLTPASLAHGALVLGFALVALFGALRFIATPLAVAGHSMEPTLSAGDRILVDRWSLRQRPPRVGEIVVCAGIGDNAGAALVKRVAVAEEAPGDVWLRGDNPDDSLDSRHFGAVSAASCHGRVILRYWPPSRAGSIR